MPRRGQRGAPTARSARTYDVEAVKPGVVWAVREGPGHRGCRVPWALKRLISQVLFLGTVVISSPWSSMIRRLVLPSSMVTILPCVAEADLDALVGDLDAAPAGDFPLDRHAGGRQRLRTGEADALELVPLAGRDGTGQGAPQDAVLGEDVHDLVVEAEPGPLPGQRGATWMTWLPRGRRRRRAAAPHPQAGGTGP